MTKTVDYDKIATLLSKCENVSLALFSVDIYREHPLCSIVLLLAEVYDTINQFQQTYS